LHVANSSCLGLYNQAILHLKDTDNRGIYRRFCPPKLHRLVSHSAPPLCFRILLVTRMRFAEFLKALLLKVSAHTQRKLSFVAKNIRRGKYLCHDSRVRKTQKRSPHTGASSLSTLPRMTLNYFTKQKALVCTRLKTHVNEYLSKQVNSSRPMKSCSFVGI